ncbi:glucose-6-phosphate isomerase [Alkalilimnicola sp. S0819]|uniref:glucose-6-phosphate isomerase n=1 Tax=Alkalilimnicola sp. S0819 TaxID=2613922 RepID=UPI001262945C|nr:glucose-6-phosphate isomerase [Alkalilimnicola sp. S0819]KAB7628346.1 glucose-6-phosphate isomerase [Alkalilimnicola sp. S0819]MPQ15247.1 glucose-6-phosphate isomerase [Alkalilimnicola sp. S0819]
MEALRSTPAWRELEKLRRERQGQTLRELFEQDAHRYQRLAFGDESLWLDLSKTHLDELLLSGLLALAREAELEAWRERLFRGEAINHTEGRAALHTLLRDPDGEPLMLADTDMRAELRDVHGRMRTLVEAVRQGDFTGHAGETITDVVQIGIGGSDTGPRLAVEALAHGADGPRVHFVANLDGVELERALSGVSPGRTLVLLISKSFNTRETLINGARARDWLLAHGGKAAVQTQLFAVTARPDRAREFGLRDERIFPLWDWVGGRYSLWSAVGLSVALALGWQAYQELLAGARAMDRHFREAPLERNLPVLLALSGIWYSNFEDAQSIAVVPYTERLARLPAYLQQLEMESNGKRVDRDGRLVDYHTALPVWGQTGTPAQHAFFQALHQGTRVVPVEFIGVAEPLTTSDGLHDELMANLFAQGQALMQGRSAEEARAEMAAEGLDDAAIARLLPYRVFPGDRPSSLLLLRRLDADALGRLIALYEHKVFVQGVIWRLNSFDQWGVELGKQLADALLPALRDGLNGAGLDDSTAGLVAQYRRWRGR